MRQKTHHGVMELLLAHLAMRDGQAQPRDKAVQITGRGFDGLHPGMYEEGLSAPFHLTGQRLPDESGLRTGTHRSERPAGRAEAC